MRKNNFRHHANQPTHTSHDKVPNELMRSSRANIQKLYIFCVNHRRQRKIKPEYRFAWHISLLLFSRMCDCLYQFENSDLRCDYGQCLGTFVIFKSNTEVNSLEKWNFPINIKQKERGRNPYIFTLFSAAQSSDNTNAGTASIIEQYIIFNTMWCYIIFVQIYSLERVSLGLNRAQ